MAKVKYNEIIVKEGFEVLVTTDRIIDAPIIIQRLSERAVITLVAWLEEVK